MNIATRPLPLSHDRPDGVTRRKWTGDEVLAMAEAGIISPGERFQLIGGDLVTMASKGARHETVRCKLLFHWVRSAPDGFMVTSKSPLEQSGSI